MWLVSGSLSSSSASHVGRRPNLVTSQRLTWDKTLGDIRYFGHAGHVPSPFLLGGDMRYSSRAESELLNLHTCGTQDMYLGQKSMVQLPSWYLPPTHQGCFWICNLHGHIKTTKTIQRHCLINLPGDLCYANGNERHQEFNTTGSSQMSCRHLIWSRRVCAK